MESNTTNGTTATAAENTHDQDADAARVRAALDEIAAPSNCQTRALQGQVVTFMQQASERAETIFELAQLAHRHFLSGEQEIALKAVRDMASSLAGDLDRSAESARTAPKLLGNFSPISEGRFWAGSDLVPADLDEAADGPGPQAVEA
jgi:hypothetical protein